MLLSLERERVMHVGRSYAGKLLRINLDVERVEVEEPPENTYREYLGGRALISRYLLSEVPPRTDPLGPDNPLLVFTGVLTGVPVPGTGRNSVGARSPLTGGFGESEVGGSFGVELKEAGYDGIIIEGRASHPVYLVIRDGTAELRSAEKLWGKTTRETHRAISESLGSESARMLAIGPAGENQVRIASIIADLKHAAGRCGLGAVMGAKSLKAIVVEGSGRVEVQDSSKVAELARWMGRNFRTLAAAFHDIGTGSAIDVMSRFGGLPTHNFRGGSFAGADDLVPYRMRGNILKGMGGCFACPIRCKKVVEVDEPYMVDPAYGGPEYETIAAFGSNCDIGDIRVVAKAHELCNAYSLDTISTGAAVSFAMECFEKGLLTRDEAGGLEVR
ncbi:MAG: aldehyde ferredoxin oxidoreductase N-terminal domain-containing protein, partial [Bacillota bacterium]